MSPARLPEGCRILDIFSPPSEGTGVDALVKAPMLVTEGLRVLEQSTRAPRENPFSGIRGTVFAGFLIVAGAIIAALSGPTWLWIILFGAGVILAVRKGG